MTTTRISSANATEFLTVNADTPLTDLLDHMEGGQKDCLTLVEDLGHYRKYVDEAIERAVRSARLDGHSWESIGRCLGTSKQAAQQRYGRGD